MSLHTEPGIVTDIDIDGRIAQGWGGSAPNGVHVNVIMARRGSPTAATMTSAFASPSNGFTPIVVCTGVDQPSYETLNPPTIMLSKSAPATDFAETLVFGAAQVGIAQGVLDAVAEHLVAADQETVIFVALWIDPAADDELSVCKGTRQAVFAGMSECVRGRDPDAIRRSLAHRDTLTHPFYSGC